MASEVANRGPSFFSFCCAAKASDEEVPILTSQQPTSLALSIHEPKEFTIHVDKASDRTLLLGLDVDTIDGPTLLINDVQYGLLMRWNQNNEGMEVRKGDRFIEVNGVKDDGAKMLVALTVNESLEIRVRRPELFFTKVYRTAGEYLGLDYSYAEGRASLVVKQIHPGLLNDWNSESKGWKVQRNDRIIAVNGYSGASPELSKMLSKPGLLDITFMKGLPGSDCDAPYQKKVSSRSPRAPKKIFNDIEVL